MTDLTDTPELRARRSVLSREDEEYRLKRKFMWGFAALYVFSSTASQLTLVALLNYLIVDARSVG